MDLSESPEERFARHAREAAEYESLKQERIRDAEERRIAAAEVQRVEFEVKTFTEPFPCIDCQTEFQAAAFTLGGAKVMQKVCPSCQKIREEEAARKIIEARARELREAWLDLCPEDYLDTDLDRTQRELESAGIVGLTMEGEQKKRIDVPTIIERVTNWPDSGLGLAILGDTGRHKTRLMLKLMERLHFAGQKVAFVNAAAMSDRIGSLLGESAKAGDEYIARLESVQNLLLDDLGKAKMTDRAEEALYRIVEARRSRRKRTFFTANCTGAELIQRMSVDRGGPIVRRLRDMTTAISFTLPKTA